jgi:hypothetical protein
MRSTLTAKHHEYSARVAYIQANLPRGPMSPQQSAHHPHGQQLGGGSGLIFPPIPIDPAPFGSPHQQHHQQQHHQQQQQQYSPQQYQPQQQQQQQYQQAPTSGGFAAPYGAPPSTKLPAHQLIKLPSQVYLGEYVACATRTHTHTQMSHRWRLLCGR